MPLRVVEDDPADAVLDLRDHLVGSASAVSSDDVRWSPELLDLGVAVAELAQDLVGVLAQRRRVRDDAGSACG